DQVPLDRRYRTSTRPRSALEDRRTKVGCAYAGRVTILAPGPDRTRRARFTRYALGSAAAVLISAVAFAAAYRLLDLGPRAASLAAFLAGALVNFSASRYWAWGRRHRRGLHRDVLGYALLAICMALTATAVTSVVHAALVDADPEQRAVLVEASY